MTHHFINSQLDPKESTATIINVSSGGAGFLNAGGSTYNISKLAEQRFSEHLQIGRATFFPPALYPKASIKDK